MSKTNSNQFSGTLGERIAQGMDPANLRNNLMSWANDALGRLNPKSKRKRNKFNTVTVAFDESTGKLYFGRNGGITKFGNAIHPELKAVLPSNNLTSHPTVWNCSESDAINRALYDGAKMGNLHILTISANKSDFGKMKCACANCTTAFKGKVKVNHSGWSTGGQP